MIPPSPIHIHRRFLDLGQPPVLLSCTDWPDAEKARAAADLATQALEAAWAEGTRPDQIDLAELANRIRQHLDILPVRAKACAVFIVPVI